VYSPSAVIDWAPASPAGGGPINFQPTGTTAIFSNLDTADYAVLNRIIPRNPARPVVFNGTVISQMRDLATGLVSRGGTLFFYSPAGILIGPTGVFDVGSLALTASDLDFDDTGAFDSAGSY
jgi:filamentous hemagglutinin family protein